MKIQELRIGQKFKDDKNKIHTIAELKTISDKDGNLTCGTVITSEGITVPPNKIKPMDNQPYLNIDNYGNTSFCINTKAGTLMAEADFGTHDGMYLMIKPNSSDDTTIDIAAIRDTPVNGESEEDMELLVFDDIDSEDPTQTSIMFASDFEAHYKKLQDTDEETKE